MQGVQIVVTEAVSAKKINARCPVLDGSAGGVAALPRTAHALIL